MRSEERAGIVAAVLLLLWGTVLTYPLHSFTVFLETVVGDACDKLPDAVPLFAVSLIEVVILAGIEIMLLLLSKTGFAIYIPVSALFLTSVSFVLECIRIRIFDVRTGVALAIILVLTALLHLLRAEKILLWEGDVFIFAISIHLFTGLVAAPLAASSEVLGKIMFIDHYKDTSLAGGFDGFLTLPSFAWGIFFMILLSLPVIYYSFSRKKA